MHELVEKYLDKMEKQKAAEEIEMSKQKAEAEIRERNKLFLKLGLYEKEYNEKNEYSIEYPIREYNSKTDTYRYYKRVPIEVTDEEYAEILKYQKKEPEKVEVKMDEKNTTASAFGVLAVITFVVGFIVGIILFFNENLSFLSGLSCWCGAFISGMFFVGISDALQLLTDIKNK